MKKSKIGTILIILATFVLAGVAIFTAIKLYQLRQTSISPIQPSSQPAAQEVASPTPTAVSSCSLSFTITVSTPTATPSGTPTATPTGTPTATPTGTPTPTPTPVAQCNNTCTSNSQCPSDLMCYIASGATTGNCRDSSCQTDSDCVCATATPTPKAGGTPIPELPASGVDWPTITGVWIGVMVILGSMLLAL